MSPLVFVPALICLFLVARGRAETAFLSVYLPTLLLLPVSYATRVPHLPPLSVSMAAVIPIGVVAIFRFAQEKRLSRMDILVGSFMISLTISEVLKEHVQNDGIFSALSHFIEMFLPYAVGRVMIEPGLRLSTVRRIVILALFLGLPGLYSWRMELNPYAPFGKILFGVDMSSAVQIRAGRGRMEASFSDAEIAGAAFGMIAALNAWLVFLHKRRLSANLGSKLSWLEKYHIPGLLMLLYILLTQSRGPLIGMVTAYLILQIPRFKNTRLASGVVAAILVLAAIGANQVIDRYTNVTDPYAVLSEQQASAMYRRQMVEIFKPVVEQGGWLGWSYGSIPKVQGLFMIHEGVQSVDSEFLFVNLGQGRLGLVLLELMIAETIRTLLVRSWRFAALEDRAFTFSMLAAMAVLWITLATVSMGEQLPQIAFLFMGWIQSLTPGTSKISAPQEVGPPAKLLFRRVFT